MDWISIVWGLLVVGLVTHAIRKELREKKHLQQHGIRTQGVVVRNKFIWGRVSVFRPVIQFTTATGEIIEAIDHSGVALAVPRFSKGEKVALIYEENNPANFRRV